MRDDGCTDKLCLEGRDLFHNRELGRTGRSCADCHGMSREKQTGLPVTNGLKVMPLHFAAYKTGPWFWNGRARSLAEQFFGLYSAGLEVGLNAETLQPYGGYKRSAWRSRVGSPHDHKA